MSKVCHSATHGCQWTPLGINGSSVPDLLALDAIIMCRKEETDGVCLGDNSVGGGLSVVELLSNEELDFLES